MNIREKLSELHRNWVVSYDEGERLGNITNVYFDKATCSIKGVSIAPRFIMNEKESFVAFNGINRLGKSVVIISSKTELSDLPDNMEGSSLRALKGTKVVTQEGEHLGELLDINVFARSGIISDIILYGPKKLKIDVKKDKISIGPDMIIVPANYRKRIEDLDGSDRGLFVVHSGKTSLNVRDSIMSAVLSVTHTKKAQERAAEPNGKRPQANGKQDKPATTPVVKQPKKEEPKKPAATSKKRPVTRAAKKATIRKRASSRKKSVSA